MLQHVFESARKLGLPVIVTDPSGRDPMVVLPLDQFEAMTESQTTDRRASAKPVRVKIGDEPTAPIVENLSSDSGESTEMTLDERFYLEPLEDESKA